MSNTADIDRLAGDVAAGRLTPREAIDQLVEQTATPDLSPTERQELREMLQDLVANDPYFGGLANRA
jgi:DNA-binding CsgD family transcriptional regulator